MKTNELARLEAEYESLHKQRTEEHAKGGFSVFSDCYNPALEKRIGRVVAKIQEAKRKLKP